MASEQLLALFGVVTVALGLVNVLMGWRAAPMIVMGSLELLTFVLLLRLLCG